MKSYSLLRFGYTDIEPHFVAIEENGEFLSYVEVTKNRATEELYIKEMRTEYPKLLTNDVDNSIGTDAESEYVFGKKIEKPSTVIANPYKLPSIEDVIEIAEYERTIKLMQDPSRYVGLAWVAFTHLRVRDYDQ